MPAERPIGTIAVYGDDSHPVFISGEQGFESLKTQSGVNTIGVLVTLGQCESCGYRELATSTGGGFHEQILKKRHKEHRQKKPCRAILTLVELGQPTWRERITRCLSEKQIKQVIEWRQGGKNAKLPINLKFERWNNHIHHCHRCRNKYNGFLT